MRLFWWQQLQLLILVQLLGPNSISPKISVEALLVCKNTVGSPQSSGRIGRYPCLGQPACVNCYQQEDPGVLSSIPGSHPLPLQTRLVKVAFVAGNLVSKTNRRVAATVEGDSDVPTLTPLSETDVKKPKKQKLAAIVGGIGATLLVVVVIVLVYICLMRLRRSIRQRSEAASSVPSPPVSSHDAQNIRQFTIMELEHATCSFSQNNIIGEGAFGLVYKGLLQDGSMVAIKRLLDTRVPSFVYELNQIAQVHNKNLVRLVGYLEDRHEQILVFDYLPNGNVGYHLYDSEGIPVGRLSMEQRLKIALDAAQALEHLHSLVPPLLHMRFRTSNVLLDENFAAKVSDYGLSKLVTEGHRPGSSSTIDCFLDPELSTRRSFTWQSDVYGFGVFLLELVSGREAHGRNQSKPEQNLAFQARRARGNAIKFMDATLSEEAMEAAEQMLELALQCIDISPRRPSMRSVVGELQRMESTEFGHLQTGFGEEIGPVTLGSELFK